MNKITLWENKEKKDFMAKWETEKTGERIRIKDILFSGHMHLVWKRLWKTEWDC